MNKVIKCLFSLPKRSLFICLFLFVNTLSAQNNYWQQQANFTIKVSLNDQENTLDAFETIEYINNSYGFISGQMLIKMTAPLSANSF